MDVHFEIRAAREDDVPQIFEMVRELARFEDLEHQLDADSDALRAALFGEIPQAEAFVASTPGPDIDVDPLYSPTEQIVGYAIYFMNFSTFLARRGLYLEDLYVRPAYRGNGIGKSFLRRLASEAVSRQCGRMEWSVLDWNRHAIEVYESIGGTLLPDWRIVRLEGRAIKTLAI